MKSLYLRSRYFNIDQVTNRPLIIKKLSTETVPDNKNMLNGCSIHYKLEINKFNYAQVNLISMPYL